MENFQSQNLKIELIKEKFLIKTLIFMIMLLSISAGATAAGYILLKAL